MRELGIKRLTAGTAINNTPSVSLYKDADGNDIVFDGGVFEVNLEKTK